jgi:hypothetical protein
MVSFGEATDTLVLEASLAGMPHTAALEDSWLAAVCVFSEAPTIMLTWLTAMAAIVLSAR